MFDLIKSSSTRIKTALALFFVFIIVSYLDNAFITWLFLGMFMIIGVHEAMKLFEVKSTLVYQFAGISWILAYFYNEPQNIVFLAGVVFASMLAYDRKIEKKILLPLLYPLASFLFILALYNDFGIKSLWWILFIVASADVGAYYVGRSLGKTKFCQTSPNKTLEGVAGGIVLAAILGPLFALDSVSYAMALVISLIVATASVFGDLFESYLKREAKVKDSGDILPGHGGILDRTDGFLFAGIVMVVLLKAIA
jgi:phosphatidate cytidylyltransferase